MPQMSPLWWMSLMVMFIIAMMICINMNYFNYNKIFKMKKIDSKKMMNWMW
nr:ATP synthase F0 subunit 8 [Eupteryx adspersa]